jgi:hypothetical protein
MERVQRKSGDLWKILVIILCFVAVDLLGAAYVSADPPAPNGTYKKTCRNISYNPAADRLTANCEKLDGSWKGTQFSNCNQCLASHGDIENCNGTIECTGVGIPNVGSYKRSCFCCRMQGSTLRCYCIARNNASRWTSLTNASSYRDISNENGTLKGRR